MKDDVWKKIYDYSLVLDVLSLGSLFAFAGLCCVVAGDLSTLPLSENSFYVFELTKGIFLCLFIWFASIDVIVLILRFIDWFLNVLARK